MPEKHECKICGHIGEDVKLCSGVILSAYYCKDGEACFNRLRALKATGPEETGTNVAKPHES